MKQGAVSELPTNIDYDQMYYYENYFSTFKSDSKRSQVHHHHHAISFVFFVSVVIREALCELKLESCCEKLVL